MLRWVGILGILASCGRLSFDPSPGDAVDGAADRANIVFLSAAEVAGGFGGIANADATCATEAASAGLPGTFVAFLSDPTTNARDRLAGSRGWTLPDGTPIGDTIASMIDADRVLNAIDMLADRTRILNGSTWTGSTLAGVFDPARNCSNWADSTAASIGQGQTIRSALIAGGNYPSCSSTRHFLCFEVGHARDVTISVTPGRFAFLTPMPTGAVDLATADARCNGDAAAAGLPGTYLAALSTSTASVASRFTLDARPWVRIDGTEVSPASEMFNGTGPLTSFINELANGTYQNTGFWTGVTSTPELVSAATDTCLDWTSTTAGNSAGIGQSHQTVRSAFWAGSTTTCDTANLHILCMQQ